MDFNHRTGATAGPSQEEADALGLHSVVQVGRRHGNQHGTRDFTVVQAAGAPIPLPGDMWDTLLSEEGPRASSTDDLGPTTLESFESRHDGTKLNLVDN